MSSFTSNLESLPQSSELQLREMIRAWAHSPQRADFLETLQSRLSTIGISADRSAPLEAPEKAAPCLLDEAVPLGVPNADALIAELRPLVEASSTKNRFRRTGRTVTKTAKQVRQVSHLRPKGHYPTWAAEQTALAKAHAVDTKKLAVVAETTVDPSRVEITSVQKTAAPRRRTTIQESIRALGSRSVPVRDHLDNYSLKIRCVQHISRLSAATPVDREGLEYQLSRIAYTFLHRPLFFSPEDVEALDCLAAENSTLPTDMKEKIKTLANVLADTVGEPSKTLPGMGNETPTHQIEPRPITGPSPTVS